MVRGFESFQSWFAGYEDCYTIIGGTACDLIMSEAGQDFRATKDIDLVLILEALTAEFCTRFWEYIDAGGYEHRNKSTGNPQFYRFTRPRNVNFPAMIELFSRKTDAISLPEGAVLTPIPLEESIASLSAILLDDSYYQFLREGKYVLNGITVLGAPYIIPFKMKAWLDLSERKASGASVDSKDIRKHRNDVFRLTQLLNPSEQIQAPAAVLGDISRFVELSANEDFNLRQLGIRMTSEELFERLRLAYGLSE